MTVTIGRESSWLIPLMGSCNSILASTLLIWNKTLRRLIFWSMTLILTTILLGLTLPLIINFTSTQSARTLRVTLKNKSNKLHVLAASWAWSSIPLNAISKPWCMCVSICLKTALSQTTTFAMLMTFMALSLHQSEARWSDVNLSKC